MFATSRFRDAVDKYNEAIAVCPNYLDYELAVLRSNISACHLKLEEWKEAIKSATEALEGLDRLEAEEAEKKADENAETAATPVVEEGKKAEEEEVEKEIVSRGASKAGPMLSAPSKDEGDEKARKRQEDILRIRAKALMRRARARSELGGWSNLAGAMEDYNRLATMTNLGPADRKIVVAQLKVLPARTKAAQAKETAEMWAKLKEVSGPSGGAVFAWNPC